MKKSIFLLLFAVTLFACGACNKREMEPTPVIKNTPGTESKHMIWCVEGWASFMNEPTVLYDNVISAYDFLFRGAEYVTSCNDIVVTYDHQAFQTAPGIITMTWQGSTPGPGGTTPETYWFNAADGTSNYDPNLANW